MDRNTHKKLLDHYLENGGDGSKIKLITAFSLANHAKLKYFIKQLNIDLPLNEIEEKPIIITPQKAQKSVFTDLISNYPKELHSAFKMRYEHWLEACSLKIELNAITIRDEAKALEVQWKLMDQLEAMDKCQKALEYYKVNKRVLEIKTTANFDDLAPIDLLKRRNNLRSSITKRNATKDRMEKGLPDKTDSKYNLKLHLLNRKIEEIQKLKNMVVKLDEMIGN